MKTVKLVLVGAFFAAVVGAGAALSARASDATQRVSGGGVTVSVTYVNPRADGDARFDVALNTHSVDLDSYDLKNLIVMRDGAANIYHPTSVETKGGGHHRQATLTFGKPKNGVKHIELVVKGVAGVHERVFQWDLK